MSNGQQPVHIAHLLWHFGTGGLENGVVNLINKLPEQGFSHSIITLTGHQSEFAKRIKRPDVQIYSLNKKEGHDWGTFYRLNRLLKQLQPDILHSRNLNTLELQLVGWWRRVPLRIHGEHGWDINDLAGSNKKYQWLRRLLQHFVHRFVCLSTESEQYLSAVIGIASAKITRICNGVDLDRFGNNAAAVFNELPADALLFGSVGRLASVKNHRLLLDAFAVLQNNPANQHCRLLLTGDGPCRDALEQQALTLGITDKVHFAGNRNDIAAIMQRIDVFVLPSLAEGISNTLLEAMAAGTAVIATAVGGNPDLMPPPLQQRNLVQSGNIGALADAMQQYAEQPDLVKLHGDLVKNYCQQHFSIDRMVQRYQALYQITGTT